MIYVSIESIESKVEGAIKVPRLHHFYRIAKEDKVQELLKI